jgi:phosphatidate cytidylyltransferase
MIYLVQVDWYGFFIVSIPVYAFLVMPVLVTLGGRETEGTVLSIGIIDLGLFLFVYCIGHIAYLALYSTWKAVLLILCVALSDAVAMLLGARGDPKWTKVLASFGASVPFTVLAAWLLSGWAEIPARHAVVLGVLIPVMVCLGRRAMRYIEADLRIGHDRLVPGRGQVCDSLASFLYAAPIAFHYIRYYLT